MVINGNNTEFDLLLDIKRVSKLHTTCICARVLELYNAYANLKFFARTEIVDVVPYVASGSILLKNLDFTGRLWEVRIFINYSGLDDKLHYCNKSRDIIMIVGFHLFCSLNVSFCPAMPNLSPLFDHLNSVFFLGL